MTEIPEVLESKKAFSGRVFDVTVDTVREGDKTYVRDVVHHPGSAVILPVPSTMARSLWCVSTGIRLCVICSNSRPAR